MSDAKIMRCTLRSFHCFIVCASLLVACDGAHETDIEPTLVFADRSDDEIMRLVVAAAGGEQSQATDWVTLIIGFSDTRTCPVVSFAADATTMTGGCEGTDGARFAGSAVLVNPSGDGGHTRYEFREFGVADQTGTSSYDGYIDIRNSGDNDVRTWDGDLTVALGATVVRSDFYSRCETSADEATTTCDVGGSGVELVGVGGARVSGINTHQNVVASLPVSEYVLQGVDRVHATFLFPPGGEGCVGWNIEGTDRHHDCPR